MHIGNYKEMPSFLSVYGQWETGESRPLHGHFCQNLNEKVLRGPGKGRRVKLLNCQEQARVRALRGIPVFRSSRTSASGREGSVPCQEPRETFHLGRSNPCMLISFSSYLHKNINKNSICFAKSYFKTKPPTTAAGA